MSLVVEDGTVVADANSYCSVAFADSYFADRGVVEWTGTNAKKEEALIRATDYIESKYSVRFKGNPETDDQSLSWPRLNVNYDGIIPIPLRKATAEYALRALTTKLAPDPVIDETNRMIASKSEKVGPISETTTYATSGTGSAGMIFRPYPAADSLLRGLVVYNGGVTRA